MLRFFDRMSGIVCRWNRLPDRICLSSENSKRNSLPNHKVAWWTLVRGTHNASGCRCWRLFRLSDCWAQPSNLAHCHVRLLYNSQKACWMHRGVRCFWANGIGLGRAIANRGQAWCGTPRRWGVRDGARVPNGRARADCRREKEFRVVFERCS